MIKRYYLPFLLVVTLISVYANMYFSDDEVNLFLFVDNEVRVRWYVFSLGWRASILITTFLVFKLSSENLKWTSFLLCLYWVVDIIEIIGWYNTTPKHLHWIIFSVLWVVGLVWNDKRRKRGNKRS